MPQASAPIVVALVGNPNSGKTTLFNFLTGARQRVGNFSGVTVTRKEGETSWRGRSIRFVDLPGIYSLSTNSMEEIVTRRYLLESKPDLILNILDAGNLERNLYLTCQLMELGGPRLHCLNMIDEAEAKGLVIDQPQLATQLGGPVVGTIGRTGVGMDRLLDAILDHVHKPVATQQPPIPYPALEEVLQRQFLPMIQEPDARYQAIQWLANAPEADGDRQRIAVEQGESLATILATGRYAYIQSLLTQCVRIKADKAQRDPTYAIDNVLLHRWLGMPIFLLIMWVMFQATFTLGALPADLIEAGATWCTEQTMALLSASLLGAFLGEGVIGGMGSVLVFLPNIMLLFLFISFFEDSGYMARAAFLMDRLMSVIGLHGKAFIPLLMGFGCNVPAIMATRAMENPRDRLLAILINPFISCSARLPVFVLFAGAFFPDHAGSVVFLINFLGLLFALSLAFLLKKSLFRGEPEPFMLEMPPYRLPTLRSVATHMWDKAVHFLRKVGGVILVGSLVIWSAQAFPREVPLSRDYPTLIAQAVDGETRTAMENALASEEQERRYLGQAGHLIAPLFAPMDFDWKTSVALLSGFLAKEVVVATLGILHHQGKVEAEAKSSGLRESLASAMSPRSAAAFMVFTLLYIPCLSTIAIIRRETGSRGWTLFAMLLSLSSAYLLAFLVYALGGLFL